MDINKVTPLEFGNTEMDVVVRETLSEDNQLSTTQWYKRLNLPKEFTKKKTENEVNNELLYNLKCENLKMLVVLKKEVEDYNKFLNEMLIPAVKEENKESEGNK
jgi:hypothetical protein